MTLSSRIALGFMLLATKAGSIAAAPPSEDIVVNGQQTEGAVSRDMQPLLEMDADAIHALGVSSVADLVKRLGAQAKGADGASPVLALNGRRPLNDDEILSLPIEAFKSFDLLPPQAAAKLGYPPNQPVMNLVTKPRFRALETQLNGQNSTDGGGGTRGGTTTLTRLEGKRRLTVTGMVSVQSELRQDRRTLVPDPSIAYDAIGNVTGAGKGEIDPRLSALAGTSVVIAPVPAASAARDTLAAYAAAANQSRVTDLGPYRSLQPYQRTLKLSGFLTQPVGAGITGSLNLSVEQQRTHSLQGLAAASLLVPGDNPASPFDTDVLLNRYLIEVPPLRQHGTMLALHAGVGLGGWAAGWTWSLRVNADRKRSETVSDLGVDTSAISSMIEQGEDPFGRYPAASLGTRLVDYSRSTITSSDAQLIVDGNALSLPAGAVAVTATLDAQRAGTNTISRSLVESDVALGRSQGGGQVTSIFRSRHVLTMCCPFSVTSRPNYREESAQ